MSYHIRKQIREKIQSYLIEMPGFTKSNIYYDDPEVVGFDNLPCIFIHTVSESTSYQSAGIGKTGGRIQNRNLFINLVYFIASNRNIQDLLDEASYKIEVCMSKDISRVKLDGIVNKCSLVNIEFEGEANTEKPSRCVKMTYEIQYQTNENRVDVQY